MYVENFNLGSSTLVDENSMVFGQYNMMTPTVVLVIVLEMLIMLLLIKTGQRIVLKADLEMKDC